MVQTSFALMTNVGRAKEAAALANGTTVVITQIAIGDGATVPSGGETALYNEVARKSISGHGTVVGATNVAYFDAYLAAADGPYTIREAGLYDDTGALIAIAHYDPAISKPVPSSGQTVEGTIRLEVAFSNVATITIVVDSSFAVALQRLSRLPWIPVISMSLATPPASPAVGDCYLIPTGATGSWAGNASNIAEYTTAGWAMIAPPNGHGISLPDGRVFERVSGAYIEKLALDAQSGKWIYAAAGGTASALTLSLSPAPPAYVAGMEISVKSGASPNPGAMTVNCNGLGAVALNNSDGLALGAGAVPATSFFKAMFDGVGFRITSYLAANSSVQINKALQNFIMIADQKAAGTSGGTFTAGAWRTRDLQTVVADPQGFIAAGLVAVAGNQVTLTAGVWLIEASAPAISVDGHKTRLQNITDATTVISGTTENTTATGTTDQVQTRSALTTTLTLASPKVFQLQHVCISTGTTYGFGIASDYGLGANNGVETYATFKATKLN